MQDRKDYESVYANIRTEVAFDYVELVVNEMKEDLEKDNDIVQQSSESIVDKTADRLRRYDQDHVDVAILWRDKTVTIHTNMLNNVFDIFWHVDGYIGCPVFAIGIKLSPCNTKLGQKETGHHTFTIDLDDKEGEDVFWNDPKLFFLKYTNKEISFDPKQEKAKQEKSQP